MNQRHGNYNKFLIKKFISIIMTDFPQGFLNLTLNLYDRNYPTYAVSGLLRSAD